jgi:hypothetical protein
MNGLVACFPNKGRVPHISLVFREMWDSTARLPLTLGASGALSDQHLW